MAIFKCVFCPRLKPGPQQPYMNAQELPWICDYHARVRAPTKTAEQMRTIHVLARKELHPQLKKSPALLRRIASGE
jgi:hypothetical protein